MNKKIKIIFIGTANLGLPAFNAILKNQDFEIVLAITQPDKPIGRKQIITSSCIKIAAEKTNITVLQPEHIIDIREKIFLLKPDLIIVAAYAQLIPEQILNLPKYGCLNLHASLLPKYRGAAIIQAAIINGDKQTGLTIIKMDKGLDTGPILGQIAIDIDKEDTAGTLYDRLSEVSVDFFINTIKKYLSGKITPEPQNSSQASYVKTLTKNDGLINWSKPAAYLEKFIRAMNPWPMPWTWWNGRQVKIISAQKQLIEINSYKPGKTFKYNSGLAVQCGQNALIIKSLQLEGKNPLKSDEFLLGHRDFIGSVLN
ncbi:methionyl-tRNA formyltransferase [Patescibacteria group bacterium]|nr:methionyl-tRNA formyltransferase [Patescibacteria group bacterium]MBU1663150.1 methionyl-tRNA formyltransferase [Patescibacteria group bacterium]MBU1934082.1 methionyl-tRNA formyltransferase [Patescibacteria group bacterium]MBU2008099.1 methionyl-tRNA formyltransferase [Patescibacteria group bacterium]MBU2233406.1 methionyl-tRNA formyltransferase [Patescibacteria group bacterium]